MPWSERISGSIVDRQGRFAEAAATYRRAITNDPSVPTPYMFLAYLNAYALDRFTDAVPLAQKAMELDPGDPSLASRLAGLNLDLGDVEEFFDSVAHGCEALAR